jgi:hypothetical protein
MRANWLPHSTGIMTDTRSFQACGDFEAKTYCPYCKRNHFWSKKAVCLEASYKGSASDIEARH